jgi:hypothetical protein
MATWFLFILYDPPFKVKPIMKQPSSFSSSRAAATTLSRPLQNPGAGVSRNRSRSRAAAQLILLLAAWMAGAANARAATYQVGPARSCQTISTLPALNPGDIVEIDPGIYHEVKRWTRPGTAAQPIVIRGVGDSRPVFDAEGQNVDGASSRPRAIFQVEGHYITLENLEFKNARNGDNGSGIRITSGNNVTVRHCKITACDMGVMCDNNRNLFIETSEIASNGTSLYDGYSHNLYLGGNDATLRFCYIHDSLNGQNFKSRAHYTALLYNCIADSQDGEIGLVDAKETAAVNSHAVMIGNIVLSKPRRSGYNSERFIQFGQDGGGPHNGTLFAINNTFVAGDGRIKFLSANAPGASIVALNNIFYGSDQIAGTLGGGIRGTNNWAASTAILPSAFYGTLKGAAPGFLNLAARDLYLSAASSCRDQGLNVLAFLDGSGASQPGLPLFEYVFPLGSRARPRDAQLDLGAYEFRAPAFNSIKREGRECDLAFTADAGNEYDLQYNGCR